MAWHSARPRSVAQERGGVAGKPGAPGIVRIGEEVGVGLRLPRPFRRGVGVQPVPELDARAQQPVRALASPPARRSSAGCCRAGRAGWPGRRTTRRRAHGTMAAASAQPARPKRRSPSTTTSGTTEGTPSTSSWSSARSRSQLAQNAWESNSVLAVGANACASPVQPKRSSRCGQSVGTDTKLSRCGPDHVLVQPVECSARSTRSRPRDGVSLLIAMNAALEDRQPWSPPLRYRNPWKVKAGSRSTAPSSARM